ncbi:hypothetical protein BDA96_03G012100 [Sorghum bicolor]|uniref:Transcription repressor n=2 Tax=Sorghum bicolor TaxID=4558 RepID=A0A921R9W3_SORBI|nr:transcription repressor OFP3 [Sorghum bicolor]EES02214.1 hypothetical protein SORBI_3003G010700 [Sorghum bicolor]KAG0535834.1 hypothetical protein BDA96_03G012100 [Sorghum bicolor]|eukprot:XP_002457094.1 transcription repressor OFP3 [Sorghum bicolor]
MDHGGGGGRSSSRLRDRLARMFRPGSLLRSTCNTTAGASSCASSSPVVGGAAAASTTKPPPPPAAASACSSSRALLAADVAGDRDSFLASSRRDLVGRTESFSTAVDRLHHHRRRRDVAAQPSRFSVDAPASVAERNKDKEKKSPRDEYGSHHHPLGGGKCDKTMIRMKLLSNPYGFSSSDDDDADTDVFSSDAEDDLAGRAGCISKRLAGESAETFFSSSRSFSSDSSEFYTKKQKKQTTTTTKTKPPAASSGKPPKPPRTTMTTAKRGQVHPAVTARRHHRRATSSCDTCGVRDGFRPVVSAAEEQVRRGFAVVKRSRDPYADFRSSMVEMIVGRQLFGPPDMERLLRSYLSLNAPRHHPVILQAFSDIWVVVHGG